MLSGKEEAGDAEADGRRGKGGGGNAVGLFDELRVEIRGAGERLQMAVEDDAFGRIADVLNGEAEAYWNGDICRPLLRDESEELVAVAELCRGGGDGIPEDITKAAQSGGSRVTGWHDGVPVRLRRAIRRGSEQLQACAGLPDLAVVEDGHHQRCTWSERDGGRQNRFLRVAGVIGVGRNGRLGKGYRHHSGSGAGRDPLPAQGAGDLQGKTRERGAGNVVEGERRTGFRTGAGWNRDGGRARRR